ncbi:hypothetical protein ACIODT_17125 [Streptomyces sp. NPDC088251]|uniref:hypothetical protein n=1 Tax=unclassified Streptomyces TaxID=2593676 RepID=UPI003818E2BF
MAWSRLRHQVVQYLRGAAGGLGQRLGAGGAVAGLDDRGQVLEQPPDAVFVFRGVRLRVGPAAGEEFGEDGAQRSEVAAAGAKEVEVVLHRPGGQDGGRERQKPTVSIR